MLYELLLHSFPDVQDNTASNMWNKNFTLNIVVPEFVLFSNVVYNYVGRYSIVICETWKTLEDNLEEYLYISEWKRLF